MNTSHVILFGIYLFIISLISDIVIHYFAIQPHANIILKSLRPYYNAYGNILSPLLAAITVVVVFIIQIFTWYVIFSHLFPTSYIQTWIFMGMAVIYGYVADVFIDKFHVFGNTLEKYYAIPGAHVWGILAYLFALIGAFTMMWSIDKVTR